MVRGSSSLPGRISKQLCGVLATLRSASEKARIVSMAAARSSPESARRLLALEAMERLAPARTPTGRPSLSREERLAGDFGKRFGRLVVVKALAEHRTGIHAAVRNGLENLRQ